MQNVKQPTWYYCPNCKSRCHRIDYIYVDKDTHCPECREMQYGEFLPERDKLGNIKYD
jgi:hypothetical protein